VVVPTRRENNMAVSLGTSLSCTHDGGPGTTLTWFRGSTMLTNTSTITIHNNGTLELQPLVDADYSPTGVEYHCVLSNQFGSVTSRTAIIQLAGKLTYCSHYLLHISIKVVFSMLRMTKP